MSFLSKDLKVYQILPTRKGGLDECVLINATLIDQIENPRITVINSKGEINDNFLDDDDISDDFSLEEDNENVESQDFINQFDTIDDQFDLNETHSATVSNMGLIYNKANVINSMINCKSKISTDRNIR